MDKPLDLDNKKIYSEEKEKTLRPFKSIIEFFDKTGFNYGDITHIKMIYGTFEGISIFNGYHTYQTTEEEYTTFVHFGAKYYSLEELKDYYLYFKNGEWHPFGIEE